MNDEVVRSLERDFYLNAVRNAFILLLVGLAVFEIRSDWSKFAIIILLLVIIFLLGIVFHYYLYGTKAPLLTLFSFGLIVIGGILMGIINDLI